MSEVAVNLPDEAYEQIRLAAHDKGIEPEKLINAIVLEWAIRDMVIRVKK